MKRDAVILAVLFRAKHTSGEEREHHFGAVFREKYSVASNSTGGSVKADAEGWPSRGLRRYFITSRMSGTWWLG